MKSVIFGLLLAALPPWLSITLADPGPQAADGDANVIVVTKELVITNEDPGTAGEPSAAPRRAIAIVHTTGDSGEPGERKVVKLRRIEGADEDGKDRGWLGVFLAPVPEALAAQLGIEGGLIVRNVAKDSPADRAGIQAHDIMVSLAGRELGGDVMVATQAISENKPGGNLDIVVLRQGQRKTFTVQLGSRAEMAGKSWNWKFSMPPGDVEERIRTRGRVMKRGPQGEWIIRDLGDLNEIENLPDNVRMWLPRSGRQQTQVTVNDGRKTIKTVIERDGSSFTVEQQDGGDITVQRTDASGTDSTKTYANEDELRNADPEAFEAYANASQATDIEVEVGDLPEHLANIHAGFDTDAFKDEMREWREELEERLGEAGDAYREAMDEFHTLMQEWKDKHGLTGDAFPMAPMFRGGRMAPPMPPPPGMLGKPRQVFEVRPDGTIEVHTRKGDAERVQLYTGEADLQARAPKLFEKYRELSDHDE